MNKKLLTFILAGVGVALIFFSLILLCASAGFVGDINDVFKPAISASGSLSYDYYSDFDYDDLSSLLTSGGSIGSDVDFNADMVRRMFDGDDAAVLRSYGINGAGFKLFALNVRGWFFWLGVISLIASAVVMAINANAKLVKMIVELGKAFAAAVVSGFKSTFVGVKFSVPRRAPRTTMYGCPKCGAAFAPGTPFCGACGTRLPSAAELGVCPKCGTVNEPGSRFCSGCGNPLA